MNDTIFLFLLISISGIFFSLINPKKAIFWKANKKSRLKGIGIYTAASTLFFILCLLPVDEWLYNATVACSPSTDIQYTVDNTDSSMNQVALSIVLPKRHYTKNTLIEIARKEHKARDWKGDFQCFFFLDAGPNSLVWARAAYLPGCLSCANYIDKDGNDIMFVPIGMATGDLNVDGSSCSAYKLPSWIYPVLVYFLLLGMVVFESLLFWGILCLYGLNIRNEKTTN